jgi:S1-C subfamily serine protease
MLTAVALDALLAPRSSAQEVQRIAPGMTKAEVYQIFGTPAAVRSVGELTYYFYPNCRTTCGTSDMVVFRNQRVINAYLRGPERVYAVAGAFPLKSTSQPISTAPVAQASGVEQNRVQRPATGGNARESRPALPPQIEHADSVLGNSVSLVLPTDDVSVQPPGAYERPRATTRVPDEAKGLVVQVVGRFSDTEAPEMGAGIILGATTQDVFIATARHVLFREGAEVRDLRVVFPGDTRHPIRATPRARTRTGLDLAVISVPVSSTRVLQGGLPAFDRRGDSRALKSGAPVNPVGCPLGVCWEAPASPDLILGIDRQGILFQTNFIAAGSSGGALFNRWWEVVGLVTTEDPPRGEAIGIDQVVDQVRYWGYPVQLRRPAVPRGGYRTTVGVSLLAPTGSLGNPLPVARIPGGRVTITHRVLPTVGWHAEFLRLAPDNLSVEAGMAGGQLTFSLGRLTPQLFFEAGLGRVEGRFDRGGYFVPSGGGNRYVPFWNQVKQDGIAVGGGVEIELVVAPRCIVQLVGGHWSFNVPDSLPRLPDLFVGAGVKVGWER